MAKVKTKELVGKGEGLSRFDIYTIRIEMSTRPTTRPGGSGEEGYPTSIRIVEKVRSFKATPGQVEKNNQQTYWNLAGTPNEHVWSFPADKVQPGMQLACDGIHVNATPRGKKPNYRYDLKIVISE